MSSVQLKFSPQAVKDLKRLHDFLLPKNPLSARKVAIEIQQASEKIKLFPKIGLPVLRNDSSDSIRDLYVNEYCIRYKIENDQLVYILRIWHGKENQN